MFFRVDAQLIQLRSELAEAKPEDKLAVEKKITEREQLLRPMYHQIAVHFADLHDTPQRMHDKGVIKVNKNTLDFILSKLQALHS